MEARIIPDTVLRAGGVFFRVLGPCPTDLTFLLLEEINTLEVRRVSASALRTGCSDGTVCMVSVDAALDLSSDQRADGSASVQIAAEDVPPALRSEKANSIFVEKVRWLKALNRHGAGSLRPCDETRSLFMEVAREMGGPPPFTLNTLYSAQLKVRKAQGAYRAIFPAFFRRGGAGQVRLSTVVEGAIGKVLSELRVDASKKIVTATVTREVRNTLLSAKATDKPPSAPTVKRRIDASFSNYEICVRNHGKAAADRKFRNTTGRVRAERALDVVQYDDTDTCLFVIDERSGLPWGRPWLTAGIDEKTQMPMGMDLSEVPRSQESALDAIFHGVFPKSITASSNCTGRWEAYGHHGIVVLDNASYNSTIAVESALLSFNTEVEYARPHHPTDKESIERFNGTLKRDFIRNLPGWSGPKEDRESLKEGIGTAVLTTQEFLKRFTKWLVDDFMNEPGDDGMSPRERWRREFKDHSPFMPRRRIDTELASSVPGTLTFRDSGGLLRLGLRYQSTDLYELQRKLGQKATLNYRYLRKSLARIFVENPITGAFLVVPCAEDSSYYQGITNYQHRLIIKSARLAGIKCPTLADLVEHRNKLAGNSLRLAGSKKMSERKASVRWDARSRGAGEPGNHPKKGAAKPKEQKTIVISALEAMVRDLQDVELEESMHAN